MLSWTIGKNEVRFPCTLATLRKAPEAKPILSPERLLLERDELTELVNEPEPLQRDMW